MKRPEVISLLRKNGFRGTTGRVALVDALSNSRSPESIDSLTKSVGGLDAANIYRALESFVVAGFVKKSNFHDGKSYYELTTDRKHHHHIVCTSCGVIEDVSDCAKSLEDTTLKKSKKFFLIEDHSLEFFGICKSCQKI